VAGVFAFHAFGVANAVCHNGTGRGKVVDLPKMSWLNFGENFHSYHHSFPGSFRFTSTGWDPTADTIEWLVKNNFAELRK
jgi:fatty-acid desaturase